MTRNIAQWLGIDLVQLHQTVRQEVKRSQRLDCEWDLAAAVSDARVDAERLDNQTFPPGPEELVRIHRRGTDWFWHFARHAPDPEWRLKFADMALERQAALETILQKKGRAVQ